MRLAHTISAPAVPHVAATLHQHSCNLPPSPPLPVNGPQHAQHAQPMRQQGARARARRQMRQSLAARLAGSGGRCGLQPAMKMANRLETPMHTATALHRECAGNLEVSEECGEMEGCGAARGASRRVAAKLQQKLARRRVPPPRSPVQSSRTVAAGAVAVDQRSCHAKHRLSVPPCLRLGHCSTKYGAAALHP